MKFIFFYLTYQFDMNSLNRRQMIKPAFVKVNDNIKTVSIYKPIYKSQTIMTSHKFQNQIHFIRSKRKGDKVQYEVQKEGVIFLRRLRNKKFRVVFNIFQQYNGGQAKISNLNLFDMLSQFDELLLNNTIIQNQNDLQQKMHNKYQSQNTQQQYDLPYLSIHNKFKPLTDNRIILIMNCFIPPHFAPHLLVFGYLISSLVLYHNFDNPFSPQSSLTALLCQFRKLLKATNIDQLNQNIKFKTGYEKTPYFLCLLVKNEKDKTSHKEYQSLLNEFYRFREEEQQSKINYALETIIDYFPERVSLGLEMQQLQYNNNKSNPNPAMKHYQLTPGGRKQVNYMIYHIDIGSQFEQTILGRQLFSFEFTASSIQSLAFELCHYFNTSQKLNLIQTYNNVIVNKKARLQIQYCDRYLEIVRQRIFLGNNIEFQSIEMIEQGKSIFPIGDAVMMKLLGEIKETIRREIMEDAVNCMSLEEFIKCWQKVDQKIVTYEEKLMRVNAENGLKFVNECYAVVEVGQEDVELLKQSIPDEGQQSIQLQPQSSSTFQLSLQQSFYPTKTLLPNLQPIPPQQIRQLFTILTTRLQSFTNQCSSLFTLHDGISEAYISAFDKLANGYLQVVGEKMADLMERVQVKLRERQLTEDTLRYQLRMAVRQQKVLEQQYQLQLLIQAQLKQQLKLLILGSQFTCSTNSTLNNSSSSNNLYQSDQQLPSQSFISFPTLSTPLSHNVFISSQKQIQKLKRKIQLLQQQCRNKDNHIQELSQLLTKFQSTSRSLSDTKYQDKFSSTTKSLIEQANTQIKKLYSVLQQVKQVEKYYQQSKNLLIKQRNKIIQQKSESFKQLQSVKEESQKVKIENKKLYQIVMDEKKALENFNALKQTFKQHIAQLQSSNTQLTCALAQEQSDKELYRKALSLVVEHSQKGKSENLAKFYKFLEHQQIKQMIKPIIGKK